MGQRESRTSNGNIFGNFFSTINVHPGCEHHCANCGVKAADGSNEERPRTRPQRTSNELGENTTQGRDEFPMGFAVEEGIEVGPPSYEETICTSNCKIIEIHEPPADVAPDVKADLKKPIIGQRGTTVILQDDKVLSDKTSTNPNAKKSWEHGNIESKNIPSAYVDKFLTVMENISEPLNADSDSVTGSCTGIGHDTNISPDPDTERINEWTDSFIKWDTFIKWGSHLVETNRELEEKLLENWQEDLQTHRNITVSRSSNVPGLIEISGYVTKREQAKILGIYYLNGFRNKRPCYRHSKTSELNMPWVWYEIGHWLIGPIYDAKKRKTFIRLRKASREDANGRYVYEAPWEQSFLPLNISLVWNNEISIKIKSKK